MSCVRLSCSLCTCMHLLGSQWGVSPALEKSLIIMRSPSFGSSSVLRLKACRIVYSRTRFAALSVFGRAIASTVSPRGECAPAPPGPERCGRQALRGPGLYLPEFSFCSHRQSDPSSALAGAILMVALREARMPSKVLRELLIPVTAGAVHLSSLSY